MLAARVQDFGAAALEPAVGIAAGPSATVTHDNGAAAAADLVSGYSDRLGDFVVLQYETGATGQQGGGDSPASPSPSHGPSSQLRPLRLGNAAGPAVLPSSLLTTLMVGLATAAAAVLL